MNRSELIIYYYELEMQRMFALSENLLINKPKEGVEVEWSECGERLDIIEQMIEEIPMDHIEKNKETGLIRQVFIGTINEQLELYIDNKKFNEKFYYTKMLIKGSGDEQFYKDERLLKLSYDVWFDWFFNLKYEREKEARTVKKQSTYVKVTVIGGEVKKIKWYNP